jgi:hypothetical protein
VKDKNLPMTMILLSLRFRTKLIAIISARQIDGKITGQKARVTVKFFLHLEVAKCLVKEGRAK